MYDSLRGQHESMVATAEVEPSSPSPIPEPERPVQPTAIRYLALAWLTQAAALSYLCRNAVGVAESSIRDDLGLSLQESGWCMGAFFWTYAVFQIPGGWFSERTGTRFALTAFALAWSAATLGIGVAPGLTVFILAQLVMGAAQAGALPASCNSIGHWMPLGQRSLACGILAVGMQAGAILASGLTGPLIRQVGWRSVFVLFALPGIAWAVAFLWRFRNQPTEDPRVNPAELDLIRPDRGPSPGDDGEQPDERTELLAIIRSPVMWWLCGQQVCRAAGYMFFASWFPTFLQKTRGISVAESGYLQGFVLAGTLAGGLLGGILTDWIWRRTGSLRLSRSAVGGVFLAACGVLTLGAWFVQSVSLAMALLTIGALLAALAGPCALATTIDIGGSRVPQVFGLMNMSGNFAAALCPVLVGKLFAWTENWNLVLLLFAGVYLLGASCWLFINPQAALRAPPAARN